MTNTESLAATASGIESLIEEWRPRLAKLDPSSVRVKPSDERWSISEVLGHLVDSACNNHQRFVRAQFCDALEFPKYDQNQWVAAANYVDCDWTDLVELWYQYNRLIANVVRNIPISASSTPCTITPYETCTLEFLVTDYLAHLQHHLTILEDRI